MAGTVVKEGLTGEKHTGETTGTRKEEVTDEAQIRRLIRSWAESLRARDVNRVMSHYSPEIVVFDIAPPLQYSGSKTHRKNWEEWFETWSGPIGYEIRDMKITVGEDVAFSHSINHITGTRTNAEETDVWVRVTSCYHRIDGNWMISHEHVSVPFYMDGSNRAAVDLRP